VARSLDCRLRDECAQQKDLKVTQSEEFGARSSEIQQIALRVASPQNQMTFMLVAIAARRRSLLVAIQMQNSTARPAIAVMFACFSRVMSKC